MAGVSRSSSIVLAWMLIYRASIEASQPNEEKKVNGALEANIAEALDGMTSLGDFLLYAQKVRPQVFPNAEFLRQLLEFEVELFGEKSISENIRSRIFSHSAKNSPIQICLYSILEVHSPTPG